MSNNQNNWYLRSLRKIADDLGQLKMNKLSSIKKNMLDAFDINLTDEQSRQIHNIISDSVDEKNRVAYMRGELIKRVSLNKIEALKVASFLSNFKN